MSRVSQAQVRCYRELADEPWKADHLKASACFDHEQLVAMGVNLYDNLVKLDEHWRLDVAEGRMAYREADHNTVRSVFAEWLAISRRVESNSVAFEKAGYVVEGAPDLRRRIAEASWCSAEPSAAFDAERMAALRDAALDEHAAKLTTDL